MSDTSAETPKPQPATTNDTPPPIPILPDPVQQLNQYDIALQALAAEEKVLRAELATKDPLESTNDTLNFAQQLLLIMRAIAKIKQERDAVLRRLAGGFGF